ncbi:hypothetical protein F52700_975 [Fusarium sp. NRRL 52700]|nr:hypothetical protein F52700_975 [Fusarium sp. NRRL 52700]
MAMAPAVLEALDDISYWDSDGDLDAKNVTRDQHNTLYDYLVERYHVVACLEALPFLVLECHGGPPHDPPFLVAGAIAIWRDAKDPFFRPLAGDFAHGDYVDIRDDMIDQIVQIDVSSKDLILFLANFWPDVDHHLERLQDLPRGIDGCFGILYNNGPVANAESTRSPEYNPDPEKLFRAADYKIGDLFLIDDAAGATQTVCYFGRRFTLGWRKDAPHSSETGTSQAGDSGNGVKYIAFEQAAFMANKPNTATSCATVPLRCLSQSLKRRQPPNLNAPECGNIRLNNNGLRSGNRIEGCIMYADSYDPEFDGQS